MLSHCFQIDSLAFLHSSYAQVSDFDFLKFPFYLLAHNHHRLYTQKEMNSNDKTMNHFEN